MIGHSNYALNLVSTFHGFVYPRLLERAMSTLALTDTIKTACTSTDSSGDALQSDGSTSAAPVVVGGDMIGSDKYIGVSLCVSGAPGPGM